MRIAMIGSGYVGLVSGACFADFGHEVVCIDTDAAKIAALSAGEIPIFEPGLSELVASNLAAKRLSFTTDLAAAVRGAAAVFLCVGTPSRQVDGHADMTYIYNAARDVAKQVDVGTLIVTKSTVPVGTGDEIARIVADHRQDADIPVVSNPEFLREGAAIRDFKYPDRIIVGTEDARAHAVMRDLYRPLFINADPIMFTSRRTAEIIKYAANAFLATKITFINEIADLCEKAGGNVQEVARGIGLDNRIGTKFLHAGPGYGGSCFPKDTMALAKTGQDHGTPLRIVETVVSINDQRKRAMARKVIAAMGGEARGKTIALLGLSFKPNTDDMREAPSLAIVQGLQDAGAIIRAYDPEGMEQAKKLMQAVTFAPDAYACVTGADAVVLITEWEAFRGLDMARVRAQVAQPVFVDLRNIYRPEDMAAQGFSYHSIGRPQ
jgi:UDPglucose 6-dehydrogenase